MPHCVASFLAQRPDCVSTPCRPWVVVGMLAVHAGLLAYSATVHSPAWDEMGHLAAGVSHWEAGTFDLYRVNPPLVRGVATAIPALLRMKPPEIDSRSYSRPWERYEFAAGSAWIHGDPLGFLNALRIARWSCIPFSLIGGVACYALSRRYFGCASGEAALLLWCSSPLVIGHGALITPDVASASFTAVALLAVARWTERWSWGRATVAGIAIGVALLTKYTTLLLAPLAGAVAVGAFWMTAGDVRPKFGRVIGQYAWMGFVAIDVVNVGYLFEGVGTPLGEYRFVSQTLRGDTRANYGNRFTGTLLAGVPVPLPSNFVQGIDVQRRDFEGGLMSYLRGNWRNRGWWHYYLYAHLVKDPAGSLTSFFAGLYSFSLLGVRRRTAIAIALPALSFFLFVSSQTGFNHHLRYMLPAYPFLYVIASAGLSVSAGRWVRRVTLAGVFLAAIESGLVFPHSMSFFNVAAGGPLAGPRHLHNSNVDWGQDLLYLAKWTDAHPAARPLQIVFSGGFGSQDLPLWDVGVRHEEIALDGLQAIGRDAGAPAWYAISVGRLYDAPLSDPRRRFFRNRTPAARIGYSIRIYQIQPDDVRGDLEIMGIHQGQTGEPQ